MDIMKIVHQAKNLIINPKGTMFKLKDEQVTMKDIIIYLAIVAAPTFLGMLIGYGFFWGGGAGQLLGYAFAMAIITYILSIIGVIVFGFLLNALAGNFKSKQNKMQALKLVSYAATPWLLLGIVNIYPVIGLIALLGGIYGLYILYLGIPIFMETPKEQEMPYFVISLIVFIVVMGLVWWLSSFIWTRLVWGAVWGSYHGGGYWYPY
ncbi:MAG: YIP1 family protein [Thermoplasmata archaeon]|nr:YIP1 family protein [Thermoplasmata archaeon]MBE3136250.1 YIP1 family protein [Thermoplasmata archaeon]MBE3140063.1 YIP1 family protein [Thermoplasmata archaeon]